ncbi:hypothetical protein GCM10022255_116860 [Dactylosporangium darangshiense]|uniref:NAD-dependent epimerase/dehydratase domain-containing protein n=1 Tax=Dactylosporangium darangshiense TaxID=579108 RepID=A0ABP8DWE6_9ACTN
MAMKVLFIGGSGIISSACARLAVERGVDQHVLNRGESRLWPMPEAATMLRADIRDADGDCSCHGDTHPQRVVSRRTRPLPGSISLRSSPRTETRQVPGRSR